MIRPSIAVSTLGILLVACGPKGDPATPTPAPAEPAATAEPTPVETPLPILAPGQVCGERHTGYVLVATYPDGCPGPRNPYAEEGEFAPVTEFELQMEEGSTSFGHVGAADMSTATVAYSGEGCAGRVRMNGDDGQLDITFAAVDDEQLQIAASWTPTGGVPCDVPMTGHYYRY